ncbi:MAG: phosphoenolpyruvate carboxykinase (ATP) [Deltaproteobacteria bacterium]|nr:phosphoenolpyruvate carboxykinase (ATP) [Deltaproteobacteria bacterium]
MSIQEKINDLIRNHKQILSNPPRQTLIQESLDRKEALASENGALVTWTPIESTGRSPKDTVIVRRPESEADIDWNSPNNLPIEASTFDMLLEDALSVLAGKEKLYMTDRVLGANPEWALEVKQVTDQALSALFTDNMFRKVPADISKSVFHERPFYLLACPYDKLDAKRYDGRLRVLAETGQTSTMAVAMDLDRRVGIVYGSAYGGSIKKLIFTVMNHYLPPEGILPLHCSANEGPDGDIALLLGLSGTGKTTLSADARRALLGDDEHGWSDNGVANFENGCYAKLIDLDPEKEPEIHKAVFHKAPVLEHGAIVENTMMYPDGHFDLFDDRFTPNSRASYPLTFLSNIKDPPVGSHPKTILFLTADANSVLPPVSRLDRRQAMLWFLMGYTSKLAGTETGIVEPKTVFSRFFGEPFMPRNPGVYATMLGERLKKHGTDVYLINTGWSGGPYGVGQRMDIRLTREMVQAALSGALKDVEYDQDPIFHLQIPRSCPGIPDNSILRPENTWQDKKAFSERAKKLAAEFSAHFDKAYGDKNIDAAIRAECPGK